MRQVRFMSPGSRTSPIITQLSLISRPAGMTSARGSTQKSEHEVSSAKARLTMLEAYE